MCRLSLERVRVLTVAGRRAPGGCESRFSWARVRVHTACLGPSRRVPEGWVGAALLPAGFWLSLPFGFGGGVWFACWVGAALLPAGFWLSLPCGCGGA